MYKPRYERTIQGEATEAYGQEEQTKNIRKNGNLLLNDKLEEQIMIEHNAYHKWLRNIIYISTSRNKIQKHDN